MTRKVRTSPYAELAENCLSLLSKKGVSFKEDVDVEDDKFVERINERLKELLSREEEEDDYIAASDEEIDSLLPTLFELAENLEKSKLEQIFSGFFTLLQKVINFEDGTIFMFNEETGKLIPVKSTSKVVELISDVKFSFGQGFTPWIAKVRKSILLNNINASKIDANVIHSFISVPVLVEGKVIGVINLGHTEAFAFSKRDVKILTIVSSQIIGALISFRQLTKLKQTNKELEDQLKLIKAKQFQIIKNERFASVMNTVVSLNHEINNPLCSLAGRLQMLQYRIDKFEDDESAPINKDINVMRSEIERITGLLQKMRNIANPVFTDYMPGIKMLDIERSIAATGV